MKSRIFISSRKVNFVPWWVRSSTYCRNQLKVHTSVACKNVIWIFLNRVRLKCITLRKKWRGLKAHKWLEKPNSRFKKIKQEKKWQQIHQKCSA